MAEDGNWERAVIEKLAMAALKEQRAARQWGIFFKIATLALVLAVIGIALGWVDGRDSVPSGPLTVMAPGASVTSTLAGSGMG